MSEIFETIQIMRKNLGPVTAYKYAVQQGYTGTEQEFAALMASYATVAQEAEAAKDDAVDAKTAAEAAQAAAEAAAEQAEGAIEVDDTLSVEGRAADAKKTGDEITGLKEDLSDEDRKLNLVISGVADIVENNTDTQTTWTSGLLTPEGVVVQNTSYYYSGRLSVSKGDVISVCRDSLVPVDKLIRLTVYSNNTPIPSLGGLNAPNPVTIADGIDEIAVTISSTYLASYTPFFRKIDTSYKSKESTELRGTTYYPFEAANSQYAKYTKCILGFWIKEPVEGAQYYLKSFRYNQNVSGVIRTEISVRSVINGTMTDHDILRKTGTYTPTKVIEYIDNGFGVVCVDWSKALSGQGYAAIPASDNKLSDTVLKQANTFPIAVESSGSQTITDMLVVTHVTEITETQKEVVQSQIDVVDSARNAANHGVLPSNDGATNYANLQTMLDNGGTIIIDVPGIYEINGMLKIDSDTELIFGKQVFMKMMNSTGGFIVNKGASTNTYNERIRISGLNLICNEKTGDSSVYRTGLRGKIAFGFVKNLILENIYVDDIPAANYFVHVAAFKDVLIQNCHIEGDKDGLHFSCGENLTIRNCQFKTNDDPIALNAQDYVSSIPYYGWIKNVLIEDCSDEPKGTNTGRSILFLGGAWDNWVSGNTYRNGDTIVAPNGYVYRFVSATAISDATVKQSTVAPTHTSGNVTESDGCEWHFVQTETVYNVGCENVTVRNYYISRTRSQVFNFHNDDSQFVRSIYPTAIMQPHKNIVLENVCVDVSSPATYLIAFNEPVDNLRLVNSKIYATYICRFQGAYGIADGNAVTNLSVIGNDFKRTSGGIVLVLCTQASKQINVKTYGNYVNQIISNNVSAGSCNMLANDLF